MGKVSIYRFDYEMKESTWTARIAAFSMQEAINQLGRMVNGPIRRFESQQEENTIDAISDELRYDINKSLFQELNRLAAENEQLKKKKAITSKPRSSK